MDIIACHVSILHGPAINVFLNMLRHGQKLYQTEQQKVWGESTQISSIDQSLNPFYTNVKCSPNQGGGKQYFIHQCVAKLNVD